MYLSGHLSVYSFFQVLLESVLRKSNLLRCLPHMQVGHVNYWLKCEMMRFFFSRSIVCANASIISQLFSCSALGVGKDVYYVYMHVAEQSGKI